LQVVTHLYSSNILYSEAIIQSVMKENKLKKTEFRCSLKEVIDLLGGKWAMPIIGCLGHGKLRFSELERILIGINTRMLVKELKNMEANQIVTRNVFATVPPTVEYALTPKGEKLLPIINELHKWGQEYY
jgi:DNA-binding HxlR family transcriptional regulator